MRISFTYSPLGNCKIEIKHQRTKGKFRLFLLSKTKIISSVKPKTQSKTQNVNRLKIKNEEEKKPKTHSPFTTIATKSGCHCAPALKLFNQLVAVCRRHSSNVIHQPLWVGTVFGERSQILVLRHGVQLGLVWRLFHIAVTSQHWSGKWRTQNEISDIAPSLSVFLWALCGKNEFSGKNRHEHFPSVNFDWKFAFLIVTEAQVTTTICGVSGLFVCLFARSLANRTGSPQGFAVSGTIEVIVNPPLGAVQLIITGSASKEQNYYNCFERVPLHNWGRRNCSIRRKSSELKGVAGVATCTARYVGFNPKPSGVPKV